MKKKILIIDDDNVIHKVLKRTLAAFSYNVVEAFDGEEGTRMAQNEHPDLIIVDQSMPKKSGRETIKDLRRNLRTQMIPIIMLTAHAELSDKIIGFEAGADEYLTKPFDIEELAVRVESLFRRTGRDQAANPLTHLPGSPAIEEFMNGRLQKNQPFAFFYIDIDNFKAYNDVYGYAKGDQIILNTAEILMKVLKEKGGDDDFLGHIGGDDFVLITDPERSEELAREITQRFDATIASFYTVDDQTRGFIVSKDRQGQPHPFPFMSLTVAIAHTEKRKITHYGQVVEIAGEIKRYLKSLTGRKGSAYLKDRWTDDFEARVPLSEPAQISNLVN